MTDQGTLAGFGTFDFIVQVMQQKHISQIEGISEQFMDRVRILETLLQKSDDNVRDHQLRIIELESTLEKEKRKLNVKEEEGASEATKEGSGGAEVQAVKTTGSAATAPSVPTAVPTAQADGPVAGTLCKQCNKKERYREGGKVHRY